MRPASKAASNTVLCQTAVLWAALIGASPFICLVGASAERARDLLENIKIWLETNPLLHEDFPEVTFPIRCLERITNRQKGQKYQGVPTRIDWSSDRVVLPVIEGSTASGVVITKIYADFQQQMATVATMLSDSDAEKYMDGFTKGIRKMAVSFGESTEALSGGLYDILSASIAPAKALDV